MNTKSKIVILNSSSSQVALFQKSVKREMQIREFWNKNSLSNRKVATHSELKNLVLAWIQNLHICHSEFISESIILNLFKKNP